MDNVFIDPLKWQPDAAPSAYFNNLPGTILSKSRDLYLQMQKWKAEGKEVLVLGDDRADYRYPDGTMVDESYRLLSPDNFQRYSGQGAVTHWLSDFTPSQLAAMNVVGDSATPIWQELVQPYTTSRMGE